MTLIDKAEALAAIEAWFAETKSFAPPSLLEAIAALPARGLHDPKGFLQETAHLYDCEISPSRDCTCGLSDLRALAALAPTAAAQARECCDLCGSDVTDMDGHLVHDEGCNGETYEPAARAREAAFLGVCECGMTGPCMWDQCKHPLISEART